MSSQRRVILSLGLWVCLAEDEQRGLDLSQHEERAYSGE